MTVPGHIIILTGEGRVSVFELGLFAWTSLLLGVIY
jgi:hypothetical protein